MDAHASISNHFVAKGFVPEASLDPGFGLDLDVCVCIIFAIK
jgi:hypothetical protein